jgi:hypothetical protein
MVMILRGMKGGGTMVGFVFSMWLKGDFEGGERNNTFALFFLCTIIVIIAN